MTIPDITINLNATERKIIEKLKLMDEKDAEAFINIVLECSKLNSEEEQLLYLEQFIGGEH